MKKFLAVVFSALMITSTAVALPQVSADYFGTSVNAISTNELSISKGILSLGKGETYRLTANQSVKWRTSNSKLLTVDQSGNVKAVGVGTAWITAKSSSGAEKSCKITVKSAPSKVSISKGVLTIGVGEEYTLSAVVPDGSAAAVRTFRTSDSKVAKMLSTNWTGKFKALKPGTAYITVRLYNGKEASCKVTVKNAPSKVTLSKGVLTLGVGESYNLTASMPDGCGSAQRSFRTSNSKVVRITKSDWTGSFVAVKPGVAYVTVRTFNGKEAACKVTVKNAPKSVSISKKTLNMTVGQTATLSAIVDKDAGCASRTFRTSDSSIVKMTNTNWTGSFKAVKPGTAWVTVRTYNGKESSCKVTVSGGSTQTKKQQTTSKWKASDHEKDKVYSTGGYVMYECPEIVQYINKYRRQAGLNEVVFMMSEANYKKVLSMYNEASSEDKDVARADCPEAFNSKGELIDIKAFVRAGGIGTRDSEEYCEVHNTLFHGNDHGTGIAEINCGAGYGNGGYDPEQWVESAKLSSAHWSILMSRDVNTIYVVYGEHACCMDIW